MKEVKQLKTILCKKCVTKFFWWKVCWGRTKLTKNGVEKLFFEEWFF